MRYSVESDYGSVEKHEVMGAGVLPISLDGSGKLVALLGRERFVQTWKGSCRWSGFEGKLSASDASITSSAARECDEETMGVVMGKSDVQHTLDTEAYLLRLVTSSTPERRFHVMFVVAVPYADYPRRFDAVRTKADQAERLIRDWRYRRPAQLGDAAAGPVEARDGRCVVDVEEADGTLREVVFSPPEDEKLRSWDRLRSIILKHECHRCIRKEVDSTWHLLQRAHVEYEHLEKDQLKWWTFESLESVLVSGVGDGVHRFKPFFLPVLEVLLSKKTQLLESLSAAAGNTEAPAPSAPRPPRACPWGAP